MTGSRIGLDTTDAIAVLNGTDGADIWIRDFREVYLPVPVVGELRFGAINSAKAEDNLQRLDEFLVRCIVLNVDLTTSHFYAEIRLDLKRKGKPIPGNDLWIAAICKQHNVPLSTGDQHFSNVDGLTVVKRQ